MNTFENVVAFRQYVRYILWDSLISALSFMYARQLSCIHLSWGRVRQLTMVPIGDGVALTTRLFFAFSHEKSCMLSHHR